MPLTADGDSANVSLDDGQSISGQRTDGWLEFESANADEIHLHIDDGTTGNQPSQYTLTIQAYKPQHDDWMFDDEYTAETTRSWSLPAVNTKMRIDVTNTSGSAGQTYRVAVEAIRGDS